MDSYERSPEEMREVRILPDFTEMAAGSVLIECGRTRVICTASVTEGVPPFLRGSGRGCMIASDGLNELARITLLPSPGWQTFTAPFACPGEKFALYLTFEGDGAIDILAFELS